MKVCPNCHGNALDSWDKCSRCGMLLPIPAPPSRPPVPVMPPLDRTKIIRPSVNVSSNAITNVSGSWAPPSIQASQGSEAPAPTLIACEACKGTISSHAQSCPHCGHPSETTPIRGSESPAALSLDAMLSQMSDDQRQRFNENRLSFNTIAQSFGGAMSINTGGNITPTVYAGTTTHRWFAFRGCEQLKELELYRLLGEADLGQQAAQREVEALGDSNAAGMMYGIGGWGGGVGIMGGFFLMTIGTPGGYDHPCIDLGMMLIIIGGIVMLVLFLMGAEKSSNATRLRGNITPLNVVAPLADEFNRKLARQILGIA